MEGGHIFLSTPSQQQQQQQSPVFAQAGVLKKEVRGREKAGVRRTSVGKQWRVRVSLAPPAPSETNGHQTGRESGREEEVGRERGGRWRGCRWLKHTDKDVPSSQAPSVVSIESP